MSKKLVHIVWADSSSPASGGWVDIEDLDTKYAEIHSVGFVLYEDDKSITIAGHLHGFDETSQYAGSMNIPKSCIINADEIKDFKHVQPSQG